MVWKKLMHSFGAGPSLAPSTFSYLGNPILSLLISKIPNVAGFPFQLLYLYRRGKFLKRKSCTNINHSYSDFLLLRIVTPLVSVYFYLNAVLQERCVVLLFCLLLSSEFIPVIFWRVSLSHVAITRTQN